MEKTELFYFFNLLKKWKYKDLELTLLPALKIPNKEDILIEWDYEEGLEHLLLKICVVAHLVYAGFERTEIFFEHTVTFGGKRCRADIYAKKQDGSLTKEFWFECGDTGKEKFVFLRKHFTGRIIWVMDYSKLHDLWEGKLSKDQSKEGIKKFRQKTFPIGIEVWGVYEGRRVVFAMRRDGVDNFTFFDLGGGLKGTGEGWSLSWWGYIRKKQDKILPFKI